MVSDDKSIHPFIYQTMYITNVCKNVAFGDRMCVEQMDPITLGSHT